MQIKRIIFVTFFATLVLILSSCYDSTEVDDMVYVLAIGIEETGNSDIQYTFQAAVPLNISSGVETGFAESEEKTTVQNISVKAKDLFSALEVANTKLAKEVNISHCKIILFPQNSSAPLLKSTITGVNNYNEFSPDTQVAFCEGKVVDYLDHISSPFEKNPARYYDIFFDKKFSLQSFSTSINDFEKSKILAIPLYDENNSAKASIISNYKNIATLSENETFALNSITGRLNNGYFSLENGKISAVIDRAHSPKIKVEIKNSVANFKIVLNFQGKIFTNSPDDEKYKEKTEEYIKNLCLNLLKNSAMHNKDIAGLIKVSRSKFFTVKSYENFDWENNFKNSQFNVIVNFQVIN